MTEKSSKLSGIILLISSVLITLIFLEIAVRVYYSNGRPSGTGMGYLHYVSQQDVLTDKYGFRNRKSPEDMQPINHVFLGDSFTAGHGVDEYENFQTRFDFAFSDFFGIEARSFNIGQGGASTKDQIKTLDKFLEEHGNLKSEESILFFQYFGNDIEDDIQLKSQETTFNSLDEILVKISGYSAFVDFIYHPFYIRKFSNSYIHDLFDGYRNDEIFAKHGNDIKDIFVKSYKEKMKIVFILFPFLNNSEIIKESSSVILNRVRRVFISNCSKGDLLFDVSKLISVRELDPKDITVNALDGHPSAQLHDAIGELLFMGAYGAQPGNSPYFTACSS